MLKAFLAIFIVAMFVFSASAFANEAENFSQPLSLMFSEDGIRSLNQALKGELIVEHEAEAEVQNSVNITGLTPVYNNVRLSSIIYADKNDWVAWINGVRYRPNTPQKDFIITDVKAGQIELMMADSSGNMRQVRLFANQTVEVASGKIVEGILR